MQDSEMGNGQGNQLTAIRLGQIDARIDIDRRFASEAKVTRSAMSFGLEDDLVSVPAQVDDSNIDKLLEVNRQRSFPKVSGMSAGPATFDDSQTVGVYWASLLRRTSRCLRRRVDDERVVDFSRGARVEASVSLDVDGSILSNLCESTGSIYFADKAPVPLVTYRKGLQLDLDVRDASGKSLNILLSDEVAHMSHAYFLYMTGVSLNLSSLPDRVLEQTYNIIRCDDGIYQLREVIDALDMYIMEDSRGVLRLGIDDDVICAWLQLLDDDATFQLLIDLSRAHFLTTLVPIQSELMVIKYRRISVSGQLPQQGTFWSRIGITPLSLTFNAQGIGFATRGHMRITAPPGMRIVGVKLLENTTAVPSERYERLVDTGRAIVYTCGLPPSYYRVVTQFVAERRTFFVPALVCSLIVLVFSGAGLWLEMTSCRFTAGEEFSVCDNPRLPLADASASVAILALIPTIFAVYYAHAGEHKLVASLHGWPRVILLIVAFMELASAGSIAVHASHGNLMLVLSVTCVSSLFAVILFTAACVAPWVRRARIAIWGTNDWEVGLIEH